MKLFEKSRSRLARTRTVERECFYRELKPESTGVRLTRTGGNLVMLSPALRQAVFRLTNISRSEPAAILFAAPPAAQIRELTPGRPAREAKPRDTK